MNFNEWWNREGSGIPPLKGHDTEEHTKRLTELAWNRATKQERQRCVMAVQAVANQGPDSEMANIQSFMSESDEKFAAGLATIVDLTKETAQVNIASGAPFLTNPKH